MIVEIAAKKNEILGDWQFPWSARTLTSPIVEITGAETEERALNELRGTVLHVIGSYRNVPTEVVFHVIEHPETRKYSCEDGRASSEREIPKINTS